MTSTTRERTATMSLRDELDAIATELHTLGLMVPLDVNTRINQLWIRVLALRAQEPPSAQFTVVYVEGHDGEHVDARCQISGCQLSSQEALSEPVFSKITRLEVIGQGREWTGWNVRIHPSVQDQGRTLKLFIERPPSPDETRTTQETT